MLNYANWYIHGNIMENVSQTVKIEVNLAKQSTSSCVNLQQMMETINA